MYSRNLKNKKFNKKTIVIVLVLVLLLVAFALVWAEKTGRVDLLNNNPKNEEPDATQEEGIDFGPPTAEEVQSGDEVPIKQDFPSNSPDQPSQDENNNNNEAKQVALIISNAGVYDGMVEVSAFTPEAIANGTCTYVFTSGSRTVTKTNLARADASSSICVDKPFPVSELSASDEWGVGVTYKSDSGNYTGTQQTVLNL